MAAKGRRRTSDKGKHAINATNINPSLNNNTNSNTNGSKLDQNSVVKVDNRKASGIAGDKAMEVDTSAMNKGKSKEGAENPIEVMNHEQHHEEGGQAEDASIEKMRGVIDHQFNLEILLKHREMQDIEEEIGKAQACLEQLRRCSLIPYPSESAPMDVVDGTGAPIQPPNGEPVPQWAPPFGVVDGPYSRHYSQWLLPDPRFDGGMVMDNNNNNNNNINSQNSSSQRPQRNSVIRAQQMKTATGGCLYRKKDGKVVRLQCTDCNRSDFHSPQGFINHCRIAHTRDYGSHEAAAEVCGIEVDEAEAMNPYQPGRSLRTSASSGPFQNTRQQSFSGILSNSNGFTDPLYSGQQQQQQQQQPLIYPHIATTKTGSHRKKVNKDKQAASSEPQFNQSLPLTPPVDDPDSPVSPPKSQTMHLKNLLKRKNMDVEGLDDMIDDVLNNTSMADLDKEIGLDDDNDGDETSEAEEARKPTTARTVTKNGRPTTGSSRGPKPKKGVQRVKLRINGFKDTSAPEYGGDEEDEEEEDDDDNSFPVVGAGKDPSIIPRDRPASLSSISSNEDLYPQSSNDQVVHSENMEMDEDMGDESQNQESLVDEPTTTIERSAPDGRGVIKKSKITANLPPPMTTRFSSRMGNS